MELQVLQSIRMKGRVGLEDLAATMGEAVTTVTAVVDSLSESGLVLAGKSVRLAPEGQARLAELLAQERAGADQATVATAYSQFRHVNSDFKTLVSDWQLRNGSPNAHDDADYDTAILARLDEVHAQTMPIIAVAAAQLPRLSAYAEKLGAALKKVQSGDTSWLTRPIIDSYHTVWFELHEELIAAAGLTREDEAAAGHG